MSEEGPCNITPPTPPPGLSAAPPDHKSHARARTRTYAAPRPAWAASDPASSAAHVVRQARLPGTWPRAPAHCVLAPRLHSQQPPVPVPPRPAPPVDASLARPRELPVAASACSDHCSLDWPRIVCGLLCFLFSSPDLAGNPGSCSAWPHSDTLFLAKRVLG